MNCLSCGASTSNGLVTCEMCQMKAAGCLEHLPVYFHNLARWRPGRAGARPVPGSRVLYDGEDRTGDSDRVQRALEQASNDIGRLAQRLTTDRSIPATDHNTEAEQVTAHCRLLAKHLTTISATEWAGVLVRKLSEHEAILRDLTEEVAPGWYAGSCGQCGASTYVIRGLTWVKCRTCGVTTYARDHLKTVLDEASDWVARPRELARAIVALVNDEDSETRLLERIKKWSQRGKIQSYRKTDDDGDEVGPKHYRLGDILDRVLDTNTTTRKAS